VIFFLILVTVHEGTLSFYFTSRAGYTKVLSKLFTSNEFKKSKCDSSVGIATGQTTGVRFLAGARNFSVLCGAQTGSGVHPAPYTMGAGGSSPEGKAASA
jgi:hypothetical protein